MTTDFPELLDIVPEYRSRNPLVRWLFLERLAVAERLGRLGEGKNLRLADLGCGEGIFAKRLAENHPAHSVTAVDHNDNVRRLQIPRVSVLQADLTRPGAIPPKSFDRIFCLDVLEHIYDLSGPLRLIRESLADDGMLIISAPSENVFHKSCRFLIKGTFSEKEGPASSPHFHRAATLARDIPAAGFELVDSVYLPLPGPLALLILHSFRKKA